MELIGDTFHQNKEQKPTLLFAKRSLFVFPCVFFPLSVTRNAIEKSESKAFIYLLKVWYSSCIIEPLGKHTRTQTKWSENHIHFVSLRQKNPYEELHSHKRRIETPIKIALRRNTNWRIHTNPVDCFRLNNHFNRFNPDAFWRIFACEFFTPSYFRLIAPLFLTYLFLCPEYRCTLTFYVPFDTSFVCRMSIWTVFFHRNMEI